MFALNNRDFLVINRTFGFAVGVSLSLCFISMDWGGMRNFLIFCSSLGKIFPPYFGLVITILFFATVGVYGVFIGGHTHSVVDMFNSFFGFSIDKIRIIGNVETSEVDVIRLLELDKSESVLSFDGIKIQKNLLALPWIAHAEIHRLYPDTIEIRLIERDPYAIWQDNNNLSLIDKNGNVIVAVKNTKFMHLPILIGKNANKEIKSFEKLLAFSGIAQFVKAYNWVSERRWNLHLYNGITIKLPEEGLNIALSNLLELQDKYKILDRDISVIDMRLPDRMAIRLTTGSFIDRQEIIERRNQELSRSGQ
ncbi:cell division protein [Candidatus Liberibacter solanacearum]|uniref:Cell division protein FtsQ n=1 Tax=Candidatus Liberibacter solanacearum TaxID=556287 RepID=A0A3R7NPS7_9HYPH|nr:cell division protein FtsQ/DivIB [Candidatus Liberibacter solanacearum]KGB27663.1 cell division protein [Candidatus Liberibacter solanacearum]RPD37127.1 cell division protein FtsQ/DivIB [Candidatus Liberibacter solanacearum]